MLSRNVANRITRMSSLESAADFDVLRLFHLICSTPHWINSRSFDASLSIRYYRSYQFYLECKKMTIINGSITNDIIHSGRYGWSVKSSTIFKSIIRSTVGTMTRHYIWMLLVLPSASNEHCTIILAVGSHCFFVVVSVSTFKSIAGRPSASLPLKWKIDYPAIK